MGVYGLETYVEAEGSSGSEDIELEYTRVVLDGNPLLYYLYQDCNLDVKSGGQYKQFHDKIVEFFRRLEEKRVQSFVLLDGASDPSGNKLRTSEERLKLKIKRVLDFDYKSQMPLLARQTFIQTIENISGVQYAVCDG